MVVVENTQKVHNVVVCTLCSCYPWPSLGLPPNWYKSVAYHSRVVIDSGAAFFGSSALTCQKASRSGFGTALRTCAISSCRSDPKERRKCLEPT